MLKPRAFRRTALADLLPSLSSTAALFPLPFCVNSNGRHSHHCCDSAPTLVVSFPPCSSEACFPFSSLSPNSIKEAEAGASFSSCVTHFPLFKGIGLSPSPLQAFPYSRRAQSPAPPSFQVGGRATDGIAWPGPPFPIETTGSFFLRFFPTSTFELFFIVTVARGAVFPLPNRIYSGPYFFVIIWFLPHKVTLFFGPYIFLPAVAPPWFPRTRPPLFTLFSLESDSFLIEKASLVICCTNVRHLFSFPSRLVAFAALAPLSSFPSAGSSLVDQDLPPLRRDIAPPHCRFLLRVFPPSQGKALLLKFFPGERHPPR